MQDASIPPEPTPSYAVLVVEDEFLIAMDIEVILQGNGHDVIGTAASVADALGCLDTLRPDVALLDVNLRGELVTPVATRLRELDIPFVLASAYPAPDFDDSDILAEAKNIGKPIHESRLIEALRQAVAEQ